LEISKFRTRQSEALTQSRRPDLWQAHQKGQKPFEKDRR
jgi:tRNA G37 N-methylase TrmD